MLSLLRSEWYQIKKSLPVKVTFIIMLITPLILEFQKLGDGPAYGGDSLCSWMNDGVGMVTACLFAGWLISTSFENRTIQEAISYGKSRAKVFWAKMLMFLAACTAVFLIYPIAGSLPSFLRYGLGTAEKVGNLCRADYIAGMLISGTLAYCSLFALCGMLAFFIRKTGNTMGISIVVILFGGNFLAMLLPENVQTIMNYTPFRLYSQVLSQAVQWADIWRTACLGLIWIAVICGITLWKFKRTELK